MCSALGSLTTSAKAFVGVASVVSVLLGDLQNGGGDLRTQSLRGNE